MSNPLSLIPLAAAARGGAVDGLEARQLVAAGLTMLQRCAPLVRTLAPGRGAVLLPDSAAYLVALAACEGRGAVLLDPEEAGAEVARRLEETGARVVFTLEQYAGAVPENVARVLLDELPGHAEFIHLTERRRVDLGSHFGLSIEGEGDSEGREEEAAIVRDGRAPGTFTSFTHRELLDTGREIMELARIVEADAVLALVPFHRLRGFTGALLAPLLAGARVTTLPRAEYAAAQGTAGKGAATEDAAVERMAAKSAAAVELLERGGITAAVGDADTFAAMISTLRQRGRALDAPSLRTTISVGQPMTPGLRDEWLEATGVELREVGTRKS